MNYGQTNKSVPVFLSLCMSSCLSLSACFVHCEFLSLRAFSRTDLLFFSRSIQTSLKWPGTSFRVSVGMSVQRGSSILQETGVSPVLRSASSAWLQITASTAAQDTSSEMATASRWCAVQVRDAEISTFCYMSVYSCHYEKHFVNFTLQRLGDFYRGHRFE